MTASLTLRAALVSAALLVAFLLLWHVATSGSGPVATMDPEYAKLVGAGASQGKSAMPGPLDV
ncbi:MAG: nitrate ABC transporter, permease protein, partial [Xanthobacteraceae bacterium]